MSDTEIRSSQKEHLFELLSIKKANTGYNVKKLGECIKNARVKMTQEDIAWVEKVIEEENE